MSMNTTELIDIAPEKVNYSKPLGLLSDVARREQVNHIPSGGKTGGYTYFTDNKIEFQFTDSEAIDWTTSALRIKVRLAGSNGVHKSALRMYSAHEIFEYTELYHDNTEVYSSFNRTTRALNNIILHQECNKDYIETEADVLTGLRTQWINTATSRTAGAVNDEEFIIPLFYFHPFFAQQQAHPIIGSRLRMVFHLASPASFLEAGFDIDDRAIVNDVALITTRIVLTPSKKAELMASIQSGDGVVLTYPDFQESKANPSRGGTESHTIKNDFNNAISLYAYTLYQPTDDLTYPQTNIGLAKKCSRLDAKCGSRGFTYGSEGSKSLLQHYALYENCSDAYSNISGQGTVTWEAYNGVLMDASSNTVAFSPLCISLERYSLPDSQITVLDSGISSQDEGCTSDIHVLMSMNTHIAEEEDLYLTLVYQRMLVWNSRGIQTLK